MMNSTLVVTLLLGQIAIEPASLDLGEVKGGTTAVAAFTLVNRGSAPAVLVDLERSCGCVEPVWTNRTLAPGEKQSLTVKIRTLGQRDGPRTWPLVLVTKAGGALERRAFEAKATLKNDIVLDPPQVALYVAKSTEQLITLVDRRDRPLRVLAWEMKAPGVRVERLSADGGTTRFKVSVDAALLAAGRHDHVLSLATDDPTYAKLEAPVTLTRVVAPRVTWSPETPEVIVAKGQKTASVLVTLRPEAGRSIDSVDTSEEGVTCTWAQNDSGAAVRVRVERDRFRGVQTLIRIVSGGEVIEAPILVRVE